MSELLKKYKELILYVVFGVLTTLVNIIIYYVCTKVLSIDYMVSNMLAWLLSVIFAYITNKMFVFDSKSLEFSQIIKEVASFFGARILSGAIDMVIMFIAVDLLVIDDFIMKIVANILIIILNYFLSKYWVFSKGKEGEN